MTDDARLFVCSLCGKKMMSEYEAVDHLCGVEPPEPTMAEVPMTTREAVTVLANQIANLTEQFTSLNHIVAEAVIVMRDFAYVYERTTK